MAVAAVQVPGVQRRQAGDVIVTALNDGFIILPPEALQGIGVDERDAFYRAAGRRPPYPTAVNGYLLQGRRRTILVDAGCGKFMGPYLGKLRANLASAGVKPEDIDTVLLTHMHTDHIGG